VAVCRQRPHRFTSGHRRRPLFGSVGVQDGVIVALAGSAPLANGGIHAWGIRIADGNVAWKRITELDSSFMA
jgi:hypothetical protein